jgi:tetrahydromethanopterin S-methyltransferase subunit F
LHTFGYYVKVANHEGRPSVDLVNTPNTSSISANVTEDTKEGIKFQTRRNEDVFIGLEVMCLSDLNICF